MGARTSKTSGGRYAAFLRGVSPMNAKMPELKRCFEEAGFTDVVTVLSSGNVVFNAPSRATTALERAAEQGMQGRLGHTFPTIVRSIEQLRALLEEDPYARYRLPPEAKRVVTLLRAKPAAKLKLPAEVDGARILEVRGSEVLSCYVPSPRGPVFMQLIEKTFGKDVTTRTWDTLQKVARK